MWLVVCGAGSWGGKGFHYKAGVHQIPTEHAQAALKFLQKHPGARSWLVLTDSKPTTATGVEPGTLQLEDVKMGVPDGVRVLSAEAPLAPEPEDPDAPPLVHGCQWCPRKFPSKGALDRHVEFEHTVQYDRIAQTLAEQAEAERLAKAEEARVKGADPKHLHPFEREGHPAASAPVEDGDAVVIDTQPQPE